MYIYSTTILLYILLYSTIYSTFCTLGLWHLTNRSNEKAEFECDFLYYFPFFVKTPYMIGNSFYLAFPNRIHLESKLKSTARINSKTF